MSLNEIGILGIFLFLILMFLRMPIGMAMALAGFIGLCLTRGPIPAFSAISSVTYSTVSSYYLSVLPLFIFMGLLAANGSVSEHAFYTMNKWLGHLKGGLAMATMCACALFGAVCGDNVATAATMCNAALPEMRRYRYDDELSLGVIATGGNLGFLIPPSMAFVLYGFITQVSVGALFIAGILPGILLTVLLCITIYFQVLAKPQLGPAGPRASWRERFGSLRYIWEVVLLFCIVMGGLYAGIFTPTEAGAVGTFACFLLGLVNRKLTGKGFLNALGETLKTSAMIYFMIIGAMIFRTFLTSSDIPIRMGEYIVSMELNRWIILGAVMLLYVILGFFLDIFGILLITLPVLFPLMTSQLGFDPIVFGVLSVICICIGCVTPPVGVLVFAVSGIVRDVPMYTIFRGCVPYVGAMIVSLILLAVFPQISVVLPNLMMPYR